MAEMIERLKGLQALQGQFIETMRHVQDVVTFGAHPDLVALEDELDIMYRGQM
jgi:hypothetical protein